ncbi:hypothetical protein ACIBEA_16610 [Streptomyces sp. NPDC051555]|uniref:hypothetical protein n=1 Tax=Streptomyces sp. NPDC051555 TaxID=3365657 RepID=UPI00379402A7
MHPEAAIITVFSRAMTAAARSNGVAEAVGHWVKGLGSVSAAFLARRAAEPVALPAIRR